MANIVIYDAYSSIHIGNGILLEKSVEALKKKYTNANLTVISMDSRNISGDYEKIEDIFAHFPRNQGFIKLLSWFLEYLSSIIQMLLGVTLSKRNEYVRSINNADIVYSISGETINSNFFYRMILRLIIVKAVSTRKEFVIFPQSIGPIKNKHRLVVSYLLKGVKKIYARDRLSEKVAKDELGLKSVVFCPDVALLYFPSRKKYSITHENRRLTIAVTISKTPKEIEADFPLVERIYQVLKSKKRSEVIIKIMPSNYSYGSTSDDYRLCKQLYNLLTDDGYEVTILENRLHQMSEFIESLRQVDVVISSRMHVMILANVLTIPTLAVNTQYKIIEFNRLIDNESWVYELNEIDKLRRKFESLDYPEIYVQHRRLDGKISGVYKKFIEVMSV